MKFVIAIVMFAFSSLAFAATQAPAPVSKETMMKVNKTKVAQRKARLAKAAKKTASAPVKAASK